MSLERFEDIEAWKQARELTRLIYRYSNKGQFRKDYNLCNQIQRAAVSVMSNIAEGFERDGNKEFIQFLAISKGSIAEVESQLYVALDNNYIDQNQFNEITKLARSIKFLLAGFIRYLRNSEYKGLKYKSKQ